MNPGFISKVWYRIDFDSPKSIGYSLINAYYMYFATRKVFLSRTIMNPNYIFRVNNKIKTANKTSV